MLTCGTSALRQACLPYATIEKKDSTHSHLISSSPPLQLGENFNGADLRNICTEAGMFAIRDERDYVVQEDFMKVGVARWM